MADPQIDYDALAAQSGGTPDYDALAKAAGAIAAPGGTPPPRPQMNRAWVNGQWVDVPADDAPQGDLLLENIRNLAGTAADVGTGAVKSLLRAGIRGGALLREIPGVDALANALPSVTVPVESTNTAQKVGGMIEQAAEVAAPARAITSLGLSTTEAVAPALTRIFGPSAARLIPRATVEAAGNIALAKAQGATNPEAAVTGAASAALPTIGQWAVQMADVLKSGATGDIARFFNPTTRGFKAVVQKQTPEILERGSDVLGTLGRSREGAVEAFGAQRATAGQAIDEALQAFGGETVQDAPQRLMAALDTAKAPYVKMRIVNPGEMTPQMEQWAVGRLPDGRVQVEIPLSPLKVNQINALKQVVQAHGDQMTIDDLVGLRRAWDEIAYAKPGATLETVKQQAGKWAKKMGGDAIRGIIQSDKPDLAALNHEFSFWRDLEQAMQATVQRKTGQVGGLLPPMAQGAGQVVGAAMGGGIPQVLAAGRLAKLAQQVFASPRYASLSANIKNGLANAIINGDGYGTHAFLTSAAARLGLVETPRLIGAAVTP